MNKGIERQINEIYRTVYKKVFDKTSTMYLSNGSRLPIMQRLNGLQSSEKYNEFAVKFAKELAKRGLSNQRGVWRKYFEAAKRAHHIALPQTYKAFELQIYAKAVRHNFEMIKSIPDRMMEILNHKYTSTLMEEVAKGTLPRGSFRKMLAEHGHKQAGVIARTETAKLQTTITETRALDIGAITYTWVSSHDKRTRPSHREMDGVIVFWRPDSEKPLLDGMRGNAGEFPNCRCDAQPNVDINDFTASSYKVYDYRIDKIVRISKNDLIKAIERGGL